MKKNLPIGIDDYRNIKEWAYWRDKSFLLKDIFRHKEGSTIVYTRPRRFGKSLALSMMGYFYGLAEGI